MKGMRSGVIRSKVNGRVGGWIRVGRGSLEEEAGKKSKTKMR